VKNSIKLLLASFLVFNAAPSFCDDQNAPTKKELSCFTSATTQKNNEQVSVDQNIQSQSKTTATTQSNHPLLKKCLQTLALVGCVSGCIYAFYLLYTIDTSYKPMPFSPEKELLACYQNLSTHANILPPSVQQLASEVCSSPLSIKNVQTMCNGEAILKNSLESLRKSTWLPSSLFERTKTAQLLKTSLENIYSINFECEKFMNTQLISNKNEGIKLAKTLGVLVCATVLGIIGNK